VQLAGDYLPCKANGLLNAYERLVLGALYVASTADCLEATSFTTVTLISTPGTHDRERSMLFFLLL
jgi:hypothetical protein